MLCVRSNPMQKINIIRRMELCKLYRVRLMRPLHFNTSKFNKYIYTNTTKKKKKTEKTDINFHLAMEFIGKHQMMSHTQAMRFHGMVRSKIYTSDVSCSSRGLGFTEKAKVRNFSANRINIQNLPS